MFNNSQPRTGNPAFRADWVVILIYLMLLAAGWFSICGASHEIGDTDFFSWGTRSGKQLVWIACSMGLGTFLLMVDEKYFDQLAVVIYIGMLVLLFVTPFIAKDIKGSRSWISLGFMNLQPAEFAKCATALALSKLIGQYGYTLSNYRRLMRAAGLVLLPMGLIVMQKETGSALVCLAFFLMFYREGMPGAILFTAVAAVVVFVVGVRFSEDILPHSHATIGQFCVLIFIWLSVCGLLRVYLPRTPHAARLLLWGTGIHIVAYAVSWFWSYDIVWVQLAWIVFCAGYLFWHGLGLHLKPYYFIASFALGSTALLYTSDYALNNVLQDHQRKRINVLLGTTTDTKDAGYNVNQSKIAIGSGGLTGKGFMNGTQTKLKYVPEQDTDFIFCTVGEEQGFIGSSAVLLLYLTLILRILYLAERQHAPFARVYGYCVFSILLFHLFINVGMVMGLTPVIGIPLPFFSYGGSSLWGFTLLIFIFLRMDAGGKQRHRI
ncbi:MAG: rod shape-determining protein RodA [Alloprevotella sp.]|nr:rod shape-determining protein RodA [Alloprevotella sp.]